MLHKFSISRTHVSGLLHALVSTCPSEFLAPTHPSASEPEEEALPITSYVCQWKLPCKCKQSTLQPSEAPFQACVWLREKTMFQATWGFWHQAPSLPEYSTRPAHQIVGQSTWEWTMYLWCVTLELSTDGGSSSRRSSKEPLPSESPSKAELQKRVQEFKNSSPVQKMRKIEQSTWDQSQSALRYSVRTV